MQVFSPIVLYFWRCLVGAVQYTQVRSIMSTSSFFYMLPHSGISQHEQWRVSKGLAFVLHRYAPLKLQLYVSVYSTPAPFLPFLSSWNGYLRLCIFNSPPTFPIMGLLSPSLYHFAVASSTPFLVIGALLPCVLIFLVLVFSTQADQHRRRS